MNSETQWSTTFCYVMGSLYLSGLVAFLFRAHDAVRNLVIAAFVAYLINPAVVYLSSQTRISRTAAVNIVYFSAVILRWWVRQPRAGGGEVRAVGRGLHPGRPA